MTPGDIVLSEFRVIGPTEPCFVIAEIGQNHQGDMRTAKELIMAAKVAGADCVKFQKSDLKEKFTNDVLSRPYISPHSWGSTYGKHKEHLEFTNEEYKELQEYCRSKNVLFTASAMDPVSLRSLHSLRVPFIKIGSGDADNIPMIENAAKLKIPLVISTGMQDMSCVEQIYQTVSKYHKNFVLLHCVSSYPTPPEDVNLLCIKTFKEKFPDINIGYSGHELGYHITLAAVALGAKVVERHITLDRTMKGNDHMCSLEPAQFAQMVSGIREIELALGDGVKTRKLSEGPCHAKLGKSIVTAEDIEVGTTLKGDHLKIKVSDPQGISPLQYYDVIGRKVNCSLKRDSPVSHSNLEEM